MANLDVEKYEDEHYVVLRFNRPQVLNALSRSMLGKLEEAMADFASDPGIHVAILTGTGKAFSAGADLVEMGERNAIAAEIERRFQNGEINASERTAAAREAGMQRPYGVNAIPKLPFGACPKPIIAAINGLCIGGGMEMAIDCDIRIASPEAYFGVFEAKRGVMAALAVQHLARVMPINEAMYLLLTGDRMTAERARELGFIQQIIPAEHLMDRAVEIAKMISANAPLSVQASKAMVQFWRHYGVEEARRLEEYVWTKVFGSEDAKEGPRAFVEKRAPNWLGA